VKDVLVLGTGAMGCFFAARLARSGAPVTLSGTWRDTLERAADPGIIVEEDDGRWTASASTVHRDALRAAAFDLTLVLVKAHQTADVAAIAARATRADGLIATLQNGWGNRETLQAAAPGRVAAGITITGIAMVGPAHVRGSYRRTVIGYDAATEARVRRAAELLDRAGLAMELSAAIDGDIWTKLAVNSALNPLSALRGVPNGVLVQDPEARDTVVAAAREAAAVARARGTPVNGDPAEVALQVAVTTARNRSSMLQDLDRGAATEVDFINGAVCREGRRLGVPTPVNDGLWRAMRERQGLGDPLAGTAA
jgi:2-dehydropantoate 2-reductase